MDKKMISKIEELAIYVAACETLDVEATLNGNGTNPCEAMNAIEAVLNVIEGDGRKWLKSQRKRINQRAKELAQDWGRE